MPRKCSLKFNPQTDIYLYKILERITGRTVDFVRETYEASSGSG